MAYFLERATASLPALHSIVPRMPYRITGRNSTVGNNRQIDFQSRYLDALTVSTKRHSRGTISVSTSTVLAMTLSVPRKSLPLLDDIGDKEMFDEQCVEKGTARTVVRTGFLLATFL